MSRINFKIIFLNQLIVLLAIAALFVLHDKLHAKQYSFKKYTQASGLASNYIFDIMQDRGGFLWIATDRGVSRFDGQTFGNFTKSDGLSANHVYCIFQDGKGAIWFGTYEGGVVKYDHHSFRIISEADGLLNNSVMHITQDHYGRMYFMTEHGLTIYKDSVLASYENKNHFSGNLFRHPSGKIFFNLDSDLYTITPQSGSMIRPLKVSLEQNQQRGISGRSWASPLLSAKNTLYYPGREHVLELNLDHKGNILDKKSSRRALFATLEDHNGKLWFAERYGVRVLNKGKAWFISKEQGLDPDYIEALCEDYEGNIWLGTMGGGLYKYKGDHLIRISEKNGLSSDLVNTIFEDASGRILVGSARGLSIIDHNFGIKNISLAIDPREITAINQDKNGNYYIGTYRHLYGPLSAKLQITDRRRQVHDVNSGVSSIVIAADNTVWVSTYGMGVLHFKDNHTESFSRADGLPSDVIEEIVSAKNALWFLSREHGAIRFGMDSLQQFSTRQGLPSDAVYSLLEESDSALWFGSDRGICRIFGQQMQIYDQRDGLIGSYVPGIFPYRDKYLIISDKALHFFKDGIIEVCAGSALLPDNNVSIKRAIFSADTQTVWLATNGGAIKVDLNLVEQRRIWLKNQYPKIIINEVSCDTSCLYRYPGPKANAPAEPPEINAEQNNIRFTFTALSFLGERPPRYRYRLQNTEHNWSEPTTKNEVIYRNLSDGNYTFQVQAINSAGIESEKPARFSFIILPPYWKRAWFYLPVLLFSFAALFLSIYWGATLKYRRNIKRLKQEQALRDERQKTRERIAGELHDDVASTLSSIRLFTESLKQRLKKEPGQSEKLLNQLGELTSNAQETMEEVVWSLSPHHDTLQDLITRINDYASELCYDNQLTCNIDLLESPVDFRISEIIRKNIYLIVKEAMHNILKHAGATQVRLRVGIDRGQFILEICDNGRGFNRDSLPKKSKGGHGLLNMEKRARQINAVFELQSGDNGTCISLCREIAQMRH